MGAIIILMGTIVLIALAFIYQSRTGRRRKLDRIKSKISEAARDHELEWTHTDISAHRGIAWSAAARKLLVVNFAKEKEEIQLFDMLGVHACNLVESGHAGASSKTIHTTSVELQLVSRDKGTIIVIPFYQEEVDGIYEKILLTQKAQNWKNILSK